jgi:hypothetical protein
VLNDDAAIAITADAASQAEGNPADDDATAYTFTVTRAGDLSVGASVEWVVQLPGGSGSTGINDFRAGQDALGSNGGLPSGTVTFAPGANTAQVTVWIATDEQVELDESFSVVLQGAGANIELTGAVATGVIANDDTGFSIVAVDANKAEGHGGTTTYTFRVTRAGDVSAAASVDWIVAGSGLSPANAADFGGNFPSGTVSFAANETSQLITIAIAGDLLVESDEGFSVTLSNARLDDNTPQNIPDPVAFGTILNDDQSFSVVAANASVAEGSSGSTQVGYTIHRTGDLTGTVTVDYVVTGSNGGNAADVVGGVLPTGTLTFGPGVDQLAVVFNVIGDIVAEADESFTLTLSNPSAGTLAVDTAVTVVLNDDTNYVLSAPAAAPEGASGSTPFVFTVTRSGATAGSGSVTWSVSPAAMPACQAAPSISRRARPAAPSPSTCRAI